MPTVLILRTCTADMRGTHEMSAGFAWPEAGPVEAPDWSPEPECGHGLHGLLWGEGRGGLLSWDEDARWLAVEVEAAEIVDLGGKVKFPRGTVVFCGDRLGATEYLIDHGARGRSVVGSTLLLRWHDSARGSYRMALAEVGATPGIEAGVAYRIEVVDGQPVWTPVKGRGLFA